MSDVSLHNPQWLREEAERCFCLAKGVLDEKDRDTLVGYGHELQDRAARMEAALKGNEEKPHR
jgi:hypothetical protein